MKKLNFIIFFVLFLSFHSFGQYFKVGVSNVKAPDPSTQQQLESVLKSMKIETYATKDTVVTYMNTMGGMVNNVVFTNPNDQSFVMYMDMMGNKMKVVPTAKELEDLKKENESKGKTAKVEEIPGKEKVILGFNCKKYKVTMNTAEGDFNVELFLAPDIKIQNNNIQGMEGVKLDGYPLEYTVNAMGAQMTFTTEKYEKDFNKNKLSPPKGNYKEVTYSELKGQIPGM